MHYKQGSEFGVAPTGNMNRICPCGNQTKKGCEWCRPCWEQGIEHRASVKKEIEEETWTLIQHWLMLGRSKNKQDRLRYRRAKMFLAQNGKCYWCNGPMTLLRRSKKNSLPANYATFEHVKRRREGGTGKDTVLAHYLCNRQYG